MYDEASMKWGANPARLTRAREQRHEHGHTKRFILPPGRARTEEPKNSNGRRTSSRGRSHLDSTLNFTLSGQRLLVVINVRFPVVVLRLALCHSHFLALSPFFMVPLIIQERMGRVPRQSFITDCAAWLEQLSKHKEEDTDLWQHITRPNGPVNPDFLRSTPVASDNHQSIPHLFSMLHKYPASLFKSVKKSGKNWMLVLSTLSSPNVRKYNWPRECHDSRRMVQRDD